MKPAYWNIVSLVLPVAAMVIGGLMVSGSRSGAGDFAGALGGGVLFLFGMAAVCVLGEIAAIAALMQGERWAGLSILGVLVNAAFILPVLYLLSRAD